MRLLRCYDEGDGSGSAATNDGATEAELATQSAQSRAFGLTPDPLSDQNKADGPTPEGDKSQKKEPTSDDGKSNLLAGKYKDQTELEAGYEHLHSHKTTLETEAVVSQQTITDLETKLAEATAKPKGPTPEETAEATSLTEAFDILEETLGTETVEALKKIIPKTAGNNELPDEVKEKLAIVDKLKSKSDQQDNDAVLNDFHKRFPGSDKPEIMKAIDDIGQKLKANPNDHALALDVLHSHAVYKELPEIAKKMAVEMLKKMSNKDREKLLATSLGSGDNAGGGAGNGKPDDTPMRARQREKFGV